MSPVVTGVGFVTPIGNGRRSVERSLREGRHGIAPVEFLGNPELPVKVAGTVKDFEVDSPSWRDWSWPADMKSRRRSCAGWPRTGCTRSARWSRRWRAPGCVPPT